MRLFDFMIEMHKHFTFQTCWFLSISQLIVCCAWCIAVTFTDDISNHWVTTTCLFNMFCFWYTFVRVCLFVPCGYLLGKGWPLGSCLWCLTVSLSLSHWYPGSGVVLDCIDSWSVHHYLLYLRRLHTIYVCHFLFYQFNLMSADALMCGDGFPFYCKVYIYFWFPNHNTWMKTVLTDALAVVRPTGVYLSDFFWSSIQLYVLLSLYLCLITFL